MNRGSIGESCETSTVSMALTEREGAEIKYIPFSILITEIFLPHDYYDDEIYEYFARNGEWVWYKVKPDDSKGLSNIAGKVYNDVRLWPEICVFNRNKLGTKRRCLANGLTIGMQLRIPVLTPSATEIITPEVSSPTPTNTPSPPTPTATVTPTATFSSTPASTP